MPRQAGVIVPGFRPEAATVACTAQCAMLCTGPTTRFIVQNETTNSIVKRGTRQQL